AIAHLLSQESRHQSPHALVASSQESIDGPMVPRHMAAWMLPTSMASTLIDVRPMVLRNHALTSLKRLVKVSLL
ncbi:MAG TPA: hypothetical protein VFE62_13515, partial [Gemmataceae bacterium]|nr:hypothetical protein [Gemmataceae bacterium]